MTVRVAAIAGLLSALLPSGADAQSYRIRVTRLENNVYQAQASGVIIETRVCGDELGLADEPEEAILNWEGRYGSNWLLFPATKVRCDVVNIR